MTRRRLDAELVRRGLTRSRAEARTAIEGGTVHVDGVVATKPASLVEDAAAIVVAALARSFVSRAGGKLDAALARFEVDVSGRDCLDAGASTGGFTDVLLHRGAARVAAVDVGYGQLAWSLRTDPRVTVIDRTNVRELDKDDLPFVPEVVVADLSFISLRVVLPALRVVAADDAIFVVLVKPQFEVGKGAVGKGGVVREPASWGDALRGVVGTAASLGLRATGAMASPLRGPAGNVEFLLRLSADRMGEADLGAAVAEGEVLVR